MTIRIRDVNGIAVALCAAKTLPESGDIYLDDNAYHALNIKFEDYFVSEGVMAAHPDTLIRQTMQKVEVEDNGG